MLTDVAPDVADQGLDVARADAEGVADAVVTLYAALRRQADLAPSPVVDALFGDLVRTCLDPDPWTAAAVLADPRVAGLAADLVRLCSDGEAALERHWATRVLTAPDPQEALAGFPYLDNYERLTRLEVGALASLGEHLGPRHRVCFVGGGPLPLSGLVLHRTTSAAVTVVDNDPVALRLASGVVDRLCPVGGLDVRFADALTGDGLAAALDGCDTVVVAALVGLDGAAKRRVLQAVARRTPPGARVVLRSAHGLRSLLYPVVDVADLTVAGLEPEILVHPLGAVVNSVLVARRR